MRDKFNEVAASPHLLMSECSLVGTTILMARKTNKG